MNFYTKIIRKLYFRIKNDGQLLPERKNSFLNGSYVHESVETSNLICEEQNSVGKECVFIGNVKLGAYTTVGRNSIFHGGEISVGRYCQIGPYTSFYAFEHPQEYLTIYNSKRLFNGELKSLSQSNPITIGSGVWIGHGACILKGVKIGNGAIVGANSVITSNVEPYSIFAGVPAKRIKNRFSDEIVEIIENSKWWNHNPSSLEKYKDLFSTKVTEMTEDQFIKLMSLKNG